MYPLKKATKLILSFSVSAVLFTACSGGEKNVKTTASSEPQSYATFTINPQSTTIYTDYPASIQGIENIELRPRVDGYIKSILVDEGAIVRKGQLLFTIEAPQFEQLLRTAKAQVSSAEAEVNSAQLLLNKTKPLVDKEIISKFDLEAAQLNLQTKLANLAQANANLENARVNVSYTQITSPADGIIGSIPYKTGSLVSSNSPQPLTTVSNISKIFAYFSLNEKQILDFSNLYEGKNINEQIKNIPPVTLVLADGTIYAQNGKIESVNGLINTGTGSASMRATFPNPTQILKSGGSAIVRIPKKFDNILLIPQTATMDIQGKKFAYILGDSSKAINTEIKILNIAKDKYYIVTEGIKAGDKILLEGFQTLTDGLVIKPEEKSTESVYEELKN